MSVDYKILGRFYAVCTSSPPMTLTATIGSSEAHAKIHYLAILLGSSFESIEQVIRSSPAFLDKIWDAFNADGGLRVVRFATPAPETGWVPRERYSEADLPAVASSCA